MVEESLFFVQGKGILEGIKKKGRRKGKGWLQTLVITLFQQNLPLFLWTRTEFAL
ncbi:hypothetical protein BREVNS_2082 [Brevinematales bacterium NS]|nr:hypothetical protein BREVNS_2082 [Brevinematales bacterium NS]